MTLSKALLPSIALVGMLSLIGCGSDSVMSTEQSTTEAKLIIFDDMPVLDSLTLPTSPKPSIIRTDVNVSELPSDKPEPAVAAPSEGIEELQESEQPPKPVAQPVLEEAAKPVVVPVTEPVPEAAEQSVTEDVTQKVSSASEIQKNFKDLNYKELDSLCLDCFPNEPIIW